MRLPDFLIIGAQKAGTSSVHRYLRQHSNIFTSKPKELNYFSQGIDRGEQALEDYAARFRRAGDDQVCGESSPSYLKAHLWPNTAKLIRETVPDVRLICLLRNPVDRTISHYQHHVWKGREKRPLMSVLDPDRNYVQSSRYAWQLSYYQDVFPPDQLLVLATEDLAEHPTASMARILRFIGVDDSFQIDTSVRHNATADHGVDDVVVTPEMRDHIASLVRDDTARLREILGADFHCWGLC